MEKKQKKDYIWKESIWERNKKENQFYKEEY